jgi:hypothetical protein
VDEPPVDGADAGLGVAQEHVELELDGRPGALGGGTVAEQDAELGAGDVTSGCAWSRFYETVRAGIYRQNLLQVCQYLRSFGSIKSKNFILSDKYWFAVFGWY